MIHATLMIFLMPSSLQRHFVFGKWQFAAAKAKAKAAAVLHAREGERGKEGEREREGGRGREGGDL